MQSKDRELFGVTIKQQTSNQFVSVSDLQKAYEKARWMHGWNAKNHSMIMQSKDFVERVYHLLKERNILKLSIISFTEMVEKEGIVKVLKGLEVWKTTGKGENKSVYCDPYIWILLAMELNPLLYAKVIIWVTDTLIFDRLEAGSDYLPMNTAIKTLTPAPDYPSYAKAINIKVFGKHQTGMRNLASSKELKKISEIEKFIIQSINAKFIKHEHQVVEAINNYN